MRCVLILLAGLISLETAQAQSVLWSDPSPHSVRMVSVEPGVHLEVLDWGGSGEALVFLPGLGNSAHSYDEFAPRFRDAYRVYGITRRGFGASSQPESGYDAAARTRDVVTLFDSLAIDRAVLVGHSFGGDELTHFAVAYPERVLALVYLDAYDYGGGLMERQMETPFPPPPPMLPEDSASVAAVQRYDARQRGITLPEAEVRATYRFDTIGRWAGFVTPYEVVVQIMTGVTPYDYSRIEAPALAIYIQGGSAAAVFPRFAVVSEEDRVLLNRFFDAIEPYVRAGKERFESEVPRGSTLEIPGANHYVHYSHADEVERAVRGFLGKQVPSLHR